MHQRAKDELRLLGEQAMLRPAGRRRQRVFLNGLSEIHFDWHTTRRTYGFLLFHADVISRIKAAGVPERFEGVQPFTLDELDGFGAPYDVDAAVEPGDIASFRAFSQAIELWHNHAHMAVEMALGVDMMNPRTNIYVEEFWRLHYFIQARFVGKLRRFRTSSSQSPVQVIGGIESHHHRFVPRI